jgi:hypothetical protein
MRQYLIIFGQIYTFYETLNRSMKLSKCVHSEKSDRRPMHGGITCLYSPE